MGYYCTVPQCTSLAGKTKNVKFHRFPRDETMADKWNTILKRGKPVTKYSKVCSLHFTQADYNVTTMGQWKTLSKDAVPSQNLPKLNPDGTVMVIRKSRTVKYREGKKDETVNSDRTEKWSPIAQPHATTLPSHNTSVITSDTQEPNLAYRLHSLNTLAHNISPNQNTTQTAQSTVSQNTTPQNTSPQNTVQHNTVPQNTVQHNTVQQKPKKQDAFMQTDPLSEEEEPSQSYSESEHSYEEYKYANAEADVKNNDVPKDFSKPQEDYMPQTNEEYNKEAEKYALERKTHYDKLENGFQKIVPEVYNSYQNRTDYVYQNSYPDSVEVLRNQQHNLQILQEQHRVTENQNFFNESHIKQEIDFGNDEVMPYERRKEQVDTNAAYDSQHRAMEQQRLLEHIQNQVKQEPDNASGCENVMQPQGSPYYSTNGSNNVPAGGYYEQLSRPGPELLIAKQNALAAHTQLWQNTMKRPFFYSESSHFNSPPLLHRYEDLTRILQ